MDVSTENSTLFRIARVRHSRELQMLLLHLRRLVRILCTYCHGEIGWWCGLDSNVGGMTINLTGEGATATLIEGGRRAQLKVMPLSIWIMPVR